MATTAPKPVTAAPKAPAFGQGQPAPSGQMVNTQAQAVNKGNLLSGLTRAGNYQPNTGTATGNQAVHDYAKGMAFQNTANAARSISQKNTEAMWQRQQANEQLYQAKRANQLAGYRQSVQQSMSNADLANQLAMWQGSMQTNWQNFAMGLMQ